MGEYNYYDIEYEFDWNITNDELESIYEEVIDYEGSHLKTLTHIHIGIIHFLLSLISIILQLLVFSSFYYKRDLFRNTCFLIMFHHGILSFIQQLCHLITSIITIFGIENIELLITIIGSLINSTYIGSILFIFLITLNRFNLFYNMNFLFKGEERKFYLFGIVICYIWVVGLFVFYLYPDFRIRFDSNIYQWHYVHPLKGILGFHLESKTIYTFLGISFVLHIFLVIKIFYLRCKTSKSKILVAGNLKLLIHAFLCFATTTVLELIWDGLLFDISWHNTWIIVPHILHIFNSVSNSIFILFFVSEIPNVSGNEASGKPENMTTTLQDNTIRKGKGKIIKVGHIGSLNAMPNAEVVLEMARKELWRDGILDDDFDVELVQKRACGESFEGVAVAADMFHLQDVKAFIGPYCSAEMDAVSKMAAYWNVPIIGYMASSNAFSDKSIYKTLARVSIRTTNSLAFAVGTALKHYNWKNVAIVTNTGVIALERTVSFEENFHKLGINVLKKITFDENADTKGIIDSGLMQDIKNTARIIICIFTKTREMTTTFMRAAVQAKMDTNDFVYIYPWLQAEAKEPPPWLDNEGKMDANVKRMFSNGIIVDDINGFDNTLTTPFVEKMEKNKLDINELDLSNVYGYIHLYDSLKLYALTVRSIMNKTGGKFELISDGKKVWGEMRRLTFPGLVSAEGVSAGFVTMDDIAERAASYGAFYISPDRDDVVKMVEMEPVFINNCDGLKTKSGCYELKVTDIVTSFWPSTDGKLPKDIPDCGFKNEKCDFTLYIVIGVIIVFVIIFVIAGLVIARILENRALANTPWRIWRDDTRTISEDEMKSMLSIGSSKTKMSNMSKFTKHHAVIGTNTHASYHIYPQKRPITFAREDIKLLNQMKLLVHDNLNPFLGMSFNEKDEMLIYWKFCSRGTVQDIIYNDDIAIDSNFHAAFIRDITAGLEYIHLSPVQYHGSLTPWACLIDRNWTVKLTDYTIANLVEKWTKQSAIDPEAIKDGENKAAAMQKTYILYCSPETLKTTESNKRRNDDKDWVKQSASRRQSSDIYSFGVVMYEILYRALPFSEGTSIDELIELNKTGNANIKPTIQDRSKIHPDLCALLLDCWNANPDVRPSIKRVRLNTEHYLKVKGSLVDQMMRVMEQYANNLEKLVQERTGMLEEANVRADKLLSQLLPAYVANELKMGRSVPPKMFEQASVMFSDIVGFTTICSSSSPLEVVNFLNSVYTGFDDIINKHDAYKVETIGDAYMVVSGIPQENGVNHLANLADVTLGMMEFLQTYIIPHKKKEKLRIRLGLHTGPVAAGVVGLTAPRYCLFGDTVNTASRMESTGVPEQIQISTIFNEKLNKHFPEFDTSLRGPVMVKGKGEINTYFLEGKNGRSITAPIPVDLQNQFGKK
uniref:Guanylate cyclase n=1 Tax=Strongyloides papillosus TaxID=174720 RepID=A0A0N5BGH1_STREA